MMARRRGRPGARTERTWAAGFGGGAAAALLLVLPACDHGIRLLGPNDGGEPPRPEATDGDAPDADAGRDDVGDPDGDLDYEPPFDGRFERPDGYCPVPGLPRLTYVENGAYALPSAAGPAPVARRRLTLAWGTIGGGCDDPVVDLEIDDSCRGALADCAFPSPELQVFDLTVARWAMTRDLPVSEVVPVGRRYAWRLRGCCPGNCCTEWNRPRYVEVGRQPNDLNGDGYGDLLVGAPRDGAAGAPPGTVYVFLGGPAPDERPDHVLTGAADGDGFGAAVAWLRDLDADGFADFGTASPAASTVQIFRGSADRAPELVFDVRRPAGSSGPYPAAAGDFDGDGFADAILAAPFGGTAEGRLEVLRGGPRPGADRWPIPCGPIGRSAAGSGDQLGNGFATVAVASVADDGLPECRPGAVALLDGAATPSEVHTGEFPFTTSWEFCHERFGRTVAAVGDVNEDGFDDLLVSDGDYPEYGLRAAALVYFGPLPPGWPGITEPALVDRADDWDTGFAEALAGVGDLNRDGHVDLAVGVPREGGPGKVRLYLGTGTTGAYVEVVLDAPVGSPAGFGAAVAGARDINGDGYDDVLVGAPGAGSESGAAYVYFGGDPPHPVPALVLGGREPGDRFGASVN